MASKGYELDLQRRLAVRDRGQTAARGTPAGRTSCRASASTTGSATTRCVRFAYARFMMPISNVRDTLGDFVNQYTGYAQTTTTLGLANGRPQQVLADPFPANNPVQQPTGQALGRYTGLGSAVSFDQYAAAAADQRPLQRVLPEGAVGGHRLRRRLLLQLGIARALHAQPQHARPVVHLRVRRAAQHAGRQPVPQLPDAGDSSRARCATTPRSPSAACSCRIRSTAPSRQTNTSAAAT